MEKKIFVLDTETSSLYNDGVCLEIAINEFNIETLDWKNVYNEIIKYELSDSILNSWIVTNGYIKEDEIKNGKELIVVKNELKELFNCNYNWTSFNVNFDKLFVSKLYNNISNPNFCLMLEMRDIMKIPHDYYGYKYPRLEEAYFYVLNELKELELLNNSNEQDHRAKNDTDMACFVLKYLIKNKKITFD